MKRGDYNRFKERVAMATEHDSVWFSQAWDYLTDRQVDDMIRLLNVHPSVIRDGRVFKLPNGVRIEVAE